MIFQKVFGLNAIGNNMEKMILGALKDYKTGDEKEQGFVKQTIKFIEKNETCFERFNLKGHITGSAWLLSPDGKKVLLTHHKKLNCWLQLGGHSDGEANTWNVALREAQEESGIEGIEFVSKDIFDVDVHTIPENKKKDEPEHQHYDIRFLLKAETEKFKISEESNALKWVTKAELLEMKKQNLLPKNMDRIVEKWINMGEPFLK
ncbi:MAG: NUDIX domain-containing protein [Alphaproteobacteria bacterium]|nr:NUDIX domain-containing protein [Alphaproteobacteria bacterium]